MNKRMNLIFTRPNDDSFEAFVIFRQKTTLKSIKNKKRLIKDDLVNEWEKFWEFLKIKPKKKNNQIIQVS
jgi:DNA/RNA-binding domain of Phe-tRNA-synthetase-like protein